MSGYLARLLAAYQSGQLQSGALTQVEVAHSTDCPALLGGKCACEPTLTLVGAPVDQSSSDGSSTP